MKPAEEFVFLPARTASNPCISKVFIVEMHHQRAEQAKPGDNVGLPRSGDVMVYKKDTTMSQTKSLMPSQVLDIPNELKCGYSPIGFVRLVAQLAVALPSSGSWARRLVARSLRILTL